MPIIPNDRRAGLPPPRFTLKTLFWTVTLLGACFAVMVYTGPHVTLLLILFGLAVLAHVAGNALGTGLRASGDRPLPNEEGGAVQRPVKRELRPTDYAPTTQLRQRASLGWIAAIITVVGAVSGAAFGAFGFSFFPEAKLATIAVGAVAAGVLGAIWSFLAASFVQVAFGAASQATKEVKRR